jgi:DNA-binding transcriptional LysR family regulator
VLAASPAYLRRAGRPTTLAELRGHSVLNYSLLSVREEWGRLIGDPGEQLDLKVPLAANNAEALAECAVQGMGIVLLPEFALAQALADGRLVQLLPEASPEPFGLFAVRPSRQFTPARLRLFIDYLRECGF